MNKNGIVGRVVFALLLLVFVAVILASSLSLSSTSRTFPLIVAVPAVILLLLQLGQEFVPRLRDFIPFLREQAIIEMELPDDLDVQANEAKPGGKEEPAGMSEWRAMAWLLALMAAMYFMHYLIVVPVFMLAFLHFQARASWKVTLGVTAGMWLVIYVLFYHLLRLAVL